MVRFKILTLFPVSFKSYLKESLVKRAIERKIISVELVAIRDFSTERHRKVDDRPFGGGPGMVLQVAPIWMAVQSQRKHRGVKRRIILFSTRGKVFDAKTAKRLSEYDELIMICGRYEGVDERVAQYIADEEISMGNYVVSGGELPALIVLEATSRFLPGFLGTHASLEEIKGSYPVYTRPEIFKPKGEKRSWKVPKVFVGGNHERIAAQRNKMGSG